MAKKVKVRFIGVQVKAHALCLRDCSVGTIYDGLLPEAGEVDKDGRRVLYEDELWVLADDAGDSVVCQLSDGFEVVE